MIDNESGVPEDAQKFENPETEANRREQEMIDKVGRDMAWHLIDGTNLTPEEGQKLASLENNEASALVSNYKRIRELRGK